ncbi:MAG: TIGR03790 family protein [Polyangiales bacterium]
MRGAVAVALALSLAPATALAVPGPDSVAVVYNRNDPGGSALATRYAEARAVPARQRCGLDAPAGDTVTLADFRARIADPLRRCLTDAGVDARIEAYALMRGLPIRVTVPIASGAQGVSLAAALMVERSRLADGTALLDAAPGLTRSCAGTPCLGARWANPFRDGAFTPGWESEAGGVRWSLRLATMLHGRSDADAERLLQSALDAERAGTVPGTWLLMDGADRARGVLDVEYDEVAAALRDLGRTDVARVSFDAASTGRTLAAFVTGTASLGATIEGNRFSPGAIVDNLTSLGAVPQNFAPTGEAQVSIARWAAMGVAGAHGAVEEPLNNCFPSRRFLVDYAEGSTLAEAYLRNMPFVYWRNLVLGDPMAAPWARRPRVTIAGVTEGVTISAPREVTVTAEPPEGASLAGVTLYVDGVEAARAADGRATLCLAGEGPRELLAVAQVAEDPGAGRHAPKGWARVRVTLRGAAGACVADEDAGAVVDASADAARDAALDAAVAPGEGGGCGCRARGGGRGGAACLVAVAAVARRRRRARR